MLKITQREFDGMYTLILRWLSVGLILTLTVRPAGAVQPDPATDEVAEAQESEDVDPHVESPVSNPEIADALSLDASRFLLGDWGGWRNELADDGITFDFQWTQHGQGVIDGGTKTGFGYGGTLDYLFEFDLDAMGVLPGAFVKVLAESRYGESVNGDVGAILPANTDMSFPLTDELDENVCLRRIRNYLSPELAVEKLSLPNLYPQFEESTRCTVIFGPESDRLAVLGPTEDQSSAELAEGVDRSPTWRLRALAPQRRYQERRD